MAKRSKIRTHTQISFRAEVIFINQAHDIFMFKATFSRIGRLYSVQSRGLRNQLSRR